MFIPYCFTCTFYSRTKLPDTGQLICEVYLTDTYCILSRQSIIPYVHYIFKNLSFMLKTVYLVQYLCVFVQ